MAAGPGIRVIIATQTEQVYELLGSRDNIRYDIALYTGTLKELLPNAQLLIIDYEDIVQYPLSETEIRQEIFDSRVYECSSEDFVANPDSYLEGLGVSQPGKMLTLPQNYCIAYVSYSGGIGRTTLALDTALYYSNTLKKYREKERRPGQERSEATEMSPMVVELTYGASSLVSLTGLEMTHLMQLATDPESQVQSYRGVDLVPMDYENVRMLAVELLERYFQRQMSRHSLTVIDGIWPHGLASALAPSVDLWIVVASDRRDTVANARKLYGGLCTEYQEEKVWLLQSQASEETETREDNEPRWHIKVPRVARPDEYQGELGRAVLAKVFAPVWEDYDAPRKSRLSRRRRE